MSQSTIKQTNLQSNASTSGSNKRPPSPSIETDPLSPTKVPQPSQAPSTPIPHNPAPSKQLSIKSPSSHVVHGSQFVSQSIAALMKSKTNSEYQFCSAQLSSASSSNSPSSPSVLAAQSIGRYFSSPRLNSPLALPKAMSPMEPFTPLSEMQLEESDNNSELPFDSHSNSPVQVPQPDPIHSSWSIQDHDTQLCHHITVQKIQYDQVQELWMDLQESAAWDDECGIDNPLFSLRAAEFLETTTVDIYALYLQQLVYHSPNLQEQVLITLPSRNTTLLSLPGSINNYPWMSSHPPDRMLIPIVDPDALHHYLYHVVFDKTPGAGLPANIYYLDSLGRASTREVEQSRDLKALAIIKKMLPFCEDLQDWSWDTVDWHQGCPTQFRQQPGSLDCGLFVCQGLSAVAFNQYSALESPLPASAMRDRLVWLMEQFGAGRIQLGAMSAPPTWFLPLHHLEPIGEYGTAANLACPGPLIPLRDIKTSEAVRKWPMPDEPWLRKPSQLGFVDMTTPEKPTVSKGSKSQMFDNFKAGATSTNTSKPWRKGSTAVNPFRKISSSTSQKTKWTHNPNKANPFPIKRKQAEGTTSKIVNPVSILQSPPSPPQVPQVDDLVHSDHAVDSTNDCSGPEVTNSSGIARGNNQPPIGFHSPGSQVPMPSAPLQSILVRSSSPGSSGAGQRLRIQKPPKSANGTGETYTSSASGLTFVFGPRESHSFPDPQVNRWVASFRDLSLQSTEYPAGMIHGPKRNIEDILQYTAVDPAKDKWAGEEVAPGVLAYQRPDGTSDQDPETGMSLLQFCTYVQGLSPEMRRWAILTGLKPDGTPLILNRLKDSLVLQKEWLVLSTDIGSMSFTGYSPKFTMIVNITPWPDRARTLTTNKKLSIIHDGAVRPLIQNFCFGLMGNNNQFRLNVFLPELVVERAKNNRHMTYVKGTVMSLWYNEVFRQALKIASKTLPDNLRPAYLQIMQELPESYLTAQNMCVGATQRGKVSKSFPMNPELLNLVVPVMRQLVASQAQFAHLRGFFHIFGMNLKTGAQSIAGREGDNLLQHTLNTCPIIDFNSANTGDVVFDFGVEVMVDVLKVPDEIRHITLLWNRS
ncbi:hypothetical protein RSAG8_08517, partial [Rhizoctonia solani AG-8 WAC10335]